MTRRAWQFIRSAWQFMLKERPMRSRTPNVFSGKILGAVVGSVICWTLAVCLYAAPQPTGQKGFASPEEAAQALIQAAQGYDLPVLLGILGAAGKDLVATDDPVADKNRAVTFAMLGRENHTAEVDKNHPGRAVLYVGNDAWPLPIPIVNRNGKWYFDSTAGRKEILFRRIGQNELDAIVVCRGFVEAQKEYALVKHDDSVLNQYAQRIISTPGKHDGLAWQNPDGSWEGPVGEDVAKFLAQGYAVDKPPFHGYYFKVLKGQGAAAPLGEMNFVVNGAMIGGFALAAAPAQYRVTGVKTFIVGSDGIVYQKDLGPNGLATFASMGLYNPDKTWVPTDDDE
jgi:DUF2950 family protein